jgi:hypothetical protein
MLLAAALSAVGVVVMINRADHGPATGRPDFPAEAKVLRDKAFTSCDAQRWDECLRGINAARDLDLAGEQNPRVKDYRQRAETALKGTPPTPPR